MFEMQYIVLAKSISSNLVSFENFTFPVMSHPCLSISISNNKR